jgi:hypothetical protein
VQAAIASDQNDWNPAGLSTASTIRVDPGGSSRNITGIAGGSAARLLRITNVAAGTQTITLVNESASSTTAANRFTFSANQVIQPNQSVFLMYDDIGLRWRAAGVSFNPGTTSEIADVGDTELAGGSGKYADAAHQHAHGDKATYTSTGWRDSHHNANHDDSFHTARNKIGIRLENVDVGVRPNINFHEGDSIDIVGADDAGNSEADITIHSVSTSLCMMAVPTTWAVPAALTEFPTGTVTRTKFDLTHADFMRIVANVGTLGSAGTALRAQYSTDNGSTWNYLDGGTGPSALIDTAGQKTSSFVALVAGAQGDVQLRIIGIGGNGATSAVINKVYLEIR